MENDTKTSKQHKYIDLFMALFFNTIQEQFIGNCT